MRVVDRKPERKRAPKTQNRPVAPQERNYQAIPTSEDSCYESVG
jgi:hypothetical protein